MMRYTIYTENKRLKTIKAILKSHSIKSYNFTFVNGVYKGKLEKALKIEIISLSGNQWHTVNRIAIEIRELNNQESVLVLSDRLTDGMLV